MLLLWHIQFILVKNVSVACRVVRASHKVIQRYVKVVREGEELVERGFPFSNFITLYSSFAGTNSLCKLFLCDTLAFPNSL